ncbi:MAG: DMT family transporter, partial [Clostridia bacterium]|nr:DMT family transporter [Clostridia bacterium]
MDKKRLKGSLLLFTAAIFWGSSFVAQDIGLRFIGPYGLNSLRFILGSIFLIPVVFAFGKIREKSGETKENIKEQRKKSIVPGIICGVSLAIASNFQQMGLIYTTPGKSGFITSMYIILVPVAGIFFHKKTKINVWIAVAISTVGLALLSIPDDFSINFGDVLTMICAVAFVANILLIDKFAEKSDGVVMSLFQLLTAGVVTFIPLLISGEQLTFQMIADAKWCII